MDLESLMTTAWRTAKLAIQLFPVVIIRDIYNHSLNQLDCVPIGCAISVHQMFCNTRLRRSPDIHSYRSRKSHNISNYDVILHVL